MSGHRLLRTAALLLLTLLGACRQDPPPAQINWFVMGTTASIAVPAAEAHTLPALQDIIRPIYDALEAELSPRRPAAPLAQLNAAAGTPQTFTLTPHFSYLLDQSLALHQASGGAFTPLAGPLMRAWGFHAPTHPTNAPPPRVDPALLDPANIIRDGHTIRLRHPGMALDYGAIAKGYAVDLATDALRQAGITNALIDLGGNLRALGQARPHTRQGWRTGIRNPFDTTQIAASFTLPPNAAVATSGNYERYVTRNGKRYPHIIDPRTQQPATGTAACVVIAPTATLADGLSTTLYVLGPQAGQTFLTNYPGCSALWIPDTPPLQITTTPNFPSISRLDRGGH